MCVIQIVTDTRGRLYEQTANKIALMIKAKTLRPGERIPSVRRLSKQHGVSIATVLQAYMALENRGLIEARPQSGYYVRPQLRELPREPAETEPPPSPSFVNVADLANKIRDVLRDPKEIVIGAGYPDVSMFPAAKLIRSVRAVAKRAGSAAVAHETPPGNYELRRLIAHRSLDWGCALAPDDIVMTVGCTEALLLCLRAEAKRGDTIAVESPVYFGLLFIIESLGMKALEIPTHPRHGINLEALDRATRRHKVAACVVTPNFQNPLGSLMPDSKKKELVEMLASRKIPIIEDDVCGDLQHDGLRPKVIKAFDKTGIVWLCSSFSKTLAPGFRVGWVAPGKAACCKVSEIKYATTGGCAVLPQMAIAEFLRTGGYDHHLRQVRHRCAKQVERMTWAISEHFPRGARLTRPQGGFLLWVELPERINAYQLHRRALQGTFEGKADHEAMLATLRISTPGQMFSPKKAYKNFLRINCGFPWSPGVDRAIANLGRLAVKG